MHVPVAAICNTKLCIELSENRFLVKSARLEIMQQLSAPLTAHKPFQIPKHFSNLNYINIHWTLNSQSIGLGSCWLQAHRKDYHSTEIEENLYIHMI